MDALSKRRTRDPIPFALRLRSLGSFMLRSHETYTLTLRHMPLSLLIFGPILFP